MHDKAESQSLTAGKFRVAVTCAVAALLLYWVTQTDFFLPVKFTVGFESDIPRGLVIYIDTGGGFNEREKMLFSRSRFNAQQISTWHYWGPAVENLRLDPGPRPGVIQLTSFCLDSYLRRRCWSGAELAQLLHAAKDIENITAHSTGLTITINGPDPYLLFTQEIDDHYVKHAHLSRYIILAAAVLLPLTLLWLWPRIKSISRELATRLSSGCGSINRWQGTAVFLLITLMVSGNWLQLDEIGLPLWICFLSVLVFLAFYSDSPPRWFSLRQPFRNCAGDGYLVGGVAVLIAVTPVFVLLISSWRQEFPYVGDQHFHVEIDRATYYFIRAHFSELVLILLSLLLCFVLGWIKLWIVAVGMFFVLWSHTESVAQYFARYPGGGRFFTTAFFYLAETFQWDSLLNAARLANAFSILIWALLLRPLIIHRWPDWSIMPVAAAFFFQTEVAYYFTTSYLEAWSLIFVLLSVEYQLRYSDDPDRAGPPLLLIGFAAIIKEAAIFLLPIVWLAGRPWRHGARHCAHSCLLAATAAIPFLIYYIIRGGERPFRMLELGQFFTFEKMIEAYYQFDFHFGAAGLVLLIVLLLWLLFNIMCYRPTRWPALILSSGMAMYFVYLNIEATSFGYAGYSRYYLFPFLLLCAGLFLLNRFLFIREQPKILVAITLLAIVLNAQVLVPYLLKTRQNDAVRNFTEHYDAPIFMPIEALIEKAESARHLDQGQRIFINNSIGWGMPSIGLNYPGIARRYKLRVAEQIPCACSEQRSVVLQTFIHFDGLNEHLRRPELRRKYQQFPKEKFFQLWVDRNKQKSTCFSSMQATCSSVHQAFTEGELIGLLGVL